MYLPLSSVFGNVALCILPFGREQLVVLIKHDNVRRVESTETQAEVGDDRSQIRVLDGQDHSGTHFVIRPAGEVVVPDAELFDIALLIFDGDGDLHVGKFQNMGEGAQDKVLVVVRVIEEQVTYVHLSIVSVSLTVETTYIELTFSRLMNGTLQGGYASAMTAITVPAVLSLSAFCHIC